MRHSRATARLLGPLFAWGAFGLAVMTASRLVAQTTQIPDELRSRAYYWAPFLVQETLTNSGCPGRASLEINQVVRADLDNDQDETNNDTNTLQYACNQTGSVDRSATVYYSAVETSYDAAGYYYLGYYWYHVRDAGFWAGSLIHDAGHEHDLEGVLLIVRKDAYSPYGVLAEVLTQAHGASLPWQADTWATSGANVRNQGHVFSWPDYRVSGMTRPVFISGGGTHATFAPQSCDAGATWTDAGFGIQANGNFYTSCIHEGDDEIFYQPMLESDIGVNSPTALATTANSGWATYQLIELYQSPLWTMRLTPSMFAATTTGPDPLGNYYYSACGQQVASAEPLEASLYDSYSAFMAFASCSDPGGANLPWFWRGEQVCWADYSCHYRFSEEGTSNYSTEQNYPVSDWYGGWVSAPNREAWLRFSNVPFVWAAMRYNPYVTSPPDYYYQPLAASISGPATVAAGTFNTWSATVSGGTPPYTYQWSGVLSGTDASVSGSIAASDYLYLDVWDAAGHHLATSTYITVSQCPDNQISC